jgi:polysaccharide deacetylase family protein (PEP-CTERM system associated)
MTPAAGRPALVLSFDLEDWNQLVHRRLGLEDWDTPHPAFARETAVILDLLDELGVRATFFVLGMTARNHPGVVEEAARRGHEIACHGLAHRRVYDQDPVGFRSDVEESAALLERLTGARPRGYRAPAFSLNRTTPWAFDVLADLGFRYDSSLYDSPRVPDRIKPIPSRPFELCVAGGRRIWEFPIASLGVAGRSLPIGGGSYWRLLPGPVVMRALGRVTDRSELPVLYFHPYELDPHPLKAGLPPRPSARQRALATYKYAWRNTGRRRIAPLIRRAAAQFRLVSHEQAFREIDDDGARPRALSAAGSLV